MIPDLNIRVLVTRTVELDTRTFTVVDNPSANHSFMGSLEPPRFAKEDDGSPRDLTPYVLRWRTGILGPPMSLEAGWRVSLKRSVLSTMRPYENEEHELLEDPREFRVGPVTYGLQVRIAPVSALYPYDGLLQEQDGTVVSEISMALWSEREEHQDTGTYEDFSGEAPVEFADELGTNRRIVTDGQIYRVTSSILDLEGPRVKFEARRANA